MQGQISEHPLAELIREIVAARLSGALRLSQSPAKVAIYFAAGQMLLATSNLRAHRLREVVKRHGLTESHVAEFSLNLSDHELAEALVDRGLLKPQALAAMRVNQVSDVLRLALLWTEGEWEFDPRVRLANDTRVEIDVSRLLRECARHLPAGFVGARLMCGDGKYSRTKDTRTNLRPVEAMVLSRVSDPVALNDLMGAGEEEVYRAIYALTLSGLLQRSDWPVALATEPAAVSTKPRAPQTVAPIVEPEKIDEEADVAALFARLGLARDHYAVLDIGRRATTEEIKTAYHSLALQFHPDRFHQSAPELRTKVESAFARITHAYETLNDSSLRAGYDSREMKSAGNLNQRATPAAQNNGTKHSAKLDVNQAETSFQHGLDALRLNRIDQAVRLLGEAAMSSPREARYRAQYGYALSHQPKTRRLAESELQAALTLEPDNASYRVMLAELYKRLGLQRRAEGELTRALAADPNNTAARSLLSTLKNKT